MDAPAQALLRLSQGYARTQALAVVAELGIADLLHDGARTADDLARLTGTDGEALYRVLRYLASNGVFAETSARHFAQTELSDALRVDASPSVRDMVRMQAREPYVAWGELGESVRTGKPAFDQVFGASRFDWLASHPAEAELFQRAMIVGVGGGGHVEVAEAYDFAKCERVVDVGGGHGQLLSAILARNPHLSGVLFDLPAGVAAAAAGLGGPLPRTELVSGDFFDDVPAGADLYLLMKVLHDWDDERASMILANCRSAMSPSGRILVVESLVPAGDAPHPAKFSDLQMLVMTGGRERTEEDFRQLFAKAGLRLERVHPTGTTLSIVEAVAS